MLSIQCTLPFITDLLCTGTVYFSQDATRLITVTHGIPALPIHDVVLRSERPGFHGLLLTFLLEDGQQEETHHAMKIAVDYATDLPHDFDSYAEQAYAIYCAMTQPLDSSLLAFKDLAEEERFAWRAVAVRLARLVTHNLDASQRAVQ